MPLTKRCVSPIDVSLHRLPSSVRQNELECVSNGTLANLVRQMSSLSKHAEDIFGELCREAMKIEHKTQSFFNRIDRISAKVTQLDSNVDEVSLQDLHLRKQFKSCTLIDQQSLSRQTMPAAMAECYSGCDRPPELDKLNPYRTDGKLALKFYTDPDYFFELWRQEMLKDAEQTKKAKNINKPKTGGSGEKKHKNKQRNQQLHHLQKSPPQNVPSPASAAESYAVNNHSSSVLASSRQNFQNQQIYNRNGQNVVNNYQVKPSASNNEQNHYLVAPPPIATTTPKNQQEVYASNITTTPFNLTNYGAAMMVAQTPTNFVEKTMSYDESRNINTITNSNNNNKTVINYRAINLQRVCKDNATSNMNDLGYGSCNLNNSNGGCDHILTSSSPEESLGSTNESDQSKLSSAACRPVRPPPAPPALNARTPGDLYTDIIKQQQQRQPSAARSQSPELPPPPPPLFLGDDDVAVVGDFAQSPPAAPLAPPTPATAPPPPPPPPPPFFQADSAATIMGKNQAAPASQQPLSNFNPNRIVRSPTGGALNGLPAPNQQKSHMPNHASLTSDLFKAIKEGKQLRKVSHLEEKKRERAAIDHGHDVAAILRKRMEDMMGDQSDDDDDDGQRSGVGGGGNGNGGSGANGENSDLDDEWDD